jgi:hypothetical protein
LATNNATAAQKIHDAIITLLLAYDGNKSAAEKSRIKKAANALKAEYDALKGRTPSKTYAEVTGKLSSARNRLLAIKNDRDKLATDFVSAGKILNSITGVLGLI